MNSDDKIVINEITNNIPIKNSLVYKNNLSPKGEYGLKRNIFDPSNDSPPNEFMLKLKMRMTIYDPPYNNEDSFAIK
jgi:hypothetical protein